MFKTDFYKTKYGGKNQDGIIYSFEKVSGWGECVEAPDGTPIELRFDKIDNEWRVTEESTGLFLNIKQPTRKLALDKITSEMLKAISENLKTDGTKNIADKLSNYILNTEKEN